MKKISTFLISSLLLSGCATITGENSQSVMITSNPEGACFTITDQYGRTVKSGKTPERVSLEKSDGSYFGKRIYSVSFEKEGYQPTKYDLHTSANGKYVLGNLFFGGLLGWFIVDPLNGGMYTISPDHISAELK